jgi:hypothetical protein
MSVLAILSLAVGIFLGLFFKPLAVIAAAPLVLAVLAITGWGLATSPLWTALAAIVLLNIGYLCGVVLSGRASSCRRLSDR